MNVTIPEVMRHVRSYFASGSITESWTIADGHLTPDLYFPGEWIAITGPDAPCGVYQLDENCALPGVPDAAWTGQIFLLNPPAAFLRLCDEIAEWAKAHPDLTMTSERFGEYSRTQTSADWRQVFASALAPYTRMYPEVTC